MSSTLASQICRAPPGGSSPLLSILNCNSMSLAKQSRSGKRSAPPLADPRMKRPFPVRTPSPLLVIGGAGLRRHSAFARPRSSWRGSGLGLVAGLCAALVLGPGLPIAPANARDWPQWRGPDRAGVWPSVQLPRRLNQGGVEKVWSARVGGGFSGVVVVGDRVLTMDRVGPAQEERVVCLDRKDGSLLWTHSYRAPYGDLDWGKGPRATPAVEGGEVFTVGAVGRVSCLRLADGKPLWSLDLQKRFGGKPPVWGHSASPLVTGDLLYLQAGGQPGATVVALDRRTGRERWRALEDRPGYSSPVMVKVGSTQQLLVWTADRLVALDPRTGGEIWQVAFRTSSYDVAIISPVSDGSRVFVSGYWDGASAWRLERGRGPEELWRSRRLSCLMSTPLWSGDHLYVLDKRDGLLCIHWPSGKVVWTDEHRLTPKGRNPHAALVWAEADRSGKSAGGLAVALNAVGELVLLNLTPEGFEDRGRVKIIQGRDAPVWAHPAFSGQEVFVRSQGEMVCARVSP